ncbi:hypothetical protein BS78_03G056300 [Paspalum vaginatum]|nr:hypothetical protein BS78_03G056300 [Paspalum vaginatum]
MSSQQAEKAAELQDPEVRAELDRRVREGGATVIKGGTGGTSLDAQERLAEGRKKGGAESHGGVRRRPRRGRGRRARRARRQAASGGQEEPRPP